MSEPVQVYTACQFVKTQKFPFQIAREHKQKLPLKNFYNFVDGIMIPRKLLVILRQYNQEYRFIIL